MKMPTRSVGFVPMIVPTCHYRRRFHSSLCTKPIGLPMPGSVITVKLIIEVRRYYFDHNATTPVSQSVLEVLVAALLEVPGNASSIHQDGQLARQRLESARRDVATLLGCEPKELVFTSGGTEADNLAILGFVFANNAPYQHVSLPPSSTPPS